MKIYHQQAANLNDSDQKIEFIFRENYNYHRVGNAYLQHEMTIEKDVAIAADGVFVDGYVIRLVNNAFAYCFKEARLSKTGSSDIEHNKYVGQISTIMRALPSKDGNLMSDFYKIGEIHAQIKNTSLKPLLVNNHDRAANKRKIEGHAPLQRFFRLCKTIKELIKQLGFHLTFKKI